ncbi:MAG: hypothetical protein L0387_23890 [Acidobacteria bacterium]|nr:hypothetical protein [Acidobacteriota bacterium]MCI0624650.1 hypothetical protein [Acidobacteriota bacterium]MCI0717816.1 hypothetical protein [Acidobacteriota bacterium]
MISVLLELLRICWTFRRRKWYWRLPFLPLPPKQYLQWRIETAYGDKRFKNLRWQDVVAYARWHRAMRLHRPAPIAKNDIWD